MLKRGLVCLVILLGTMSMASQSVAEEITVYTARSLSLIKPVLTAYTKETGVKVKVVTGTAGELLSRIKSEGKETWADLLLTVDAGSLWLAERDGLLQPVHDKGIKKHIPSHFRDPDDMWFGISMRARTIVYSTERVKPSELSTYRDLASPKWKGRLCLRTSGKVYNKSLIAMLISRHGARKAERIVKGWVDNLAVVPFKRDSHVMSAIKAGTCDLGLINTYYFGRLQRRGKDNSIALFWANQKDSGTHVDISGAAVTRYAPNKAGAVKFLKWLTGRNAQSFYANGNMEYPVNPEVKAHKDVLAWGEFKHCSENLSVSGELRQQAEELIKRAGYR